MTTQPNNLSRMIPRLRPGDEISYWCNVAEQYKVATVLKVALSGIQVCLPVVQQGVPEILYRSLEWHEIFPPF